MFTEGEPSGPGPLQRRDLHVPTRLRKLAVGSRKLSDDRESLRSRKKGREGGFVHPEQQGRAEMSAKHPEPRAAVLSHAPRRLRWPFRLTGPLRLGRAFWRRRASQGGALCSPLASCQEGRTPWKMASREPASSVSPVPWAVALLVALGVERALALPEICTQCPGSVQNLSRVAVYCQEKSELMQGRCCVNEKGTILGLDLQNCSLKDPGPNFTQAHTAVIIDLQANPLKDNLTNTFHGFTQLQTLILPPDAICPGGINAWETITSYVGNQICQGQKDLCNSTGIPDMCPENGSCAPDGPGLLQCVCADGFHGYKCMQQGSFPMLMFFGILGSTTLCISILLWGTQRRKAKAS